MELKGIKDEDFVNFKEPSMVLLFPHCTFKCDRENCVELCHGRGLDLDPTMQVNTHDLINRFLSNPITKAVVCSGLEPMDSYQELLEFIFQLRVFTKAPIVIYTGYEPNEIKDKISQLKKFENIYMKYGRFRPGQEKHWDEVLGVYLASDNQRGVKIS